MFNTPTLITASATTVVSTGETNLFSVIIPVALDGTATFTNTAGTTYFVLPANTVGDFEFSCQLNDGLKVVNAATKTLIVNTNQ